ncbi:MAG: hypothetical protein N2C13_04595, partial [Chloroflexota bacterium]
VIPAHVLVTVARNGGLVLARYNGEEMNGMLFGFVGMTARPNRPKFKHCSHILGVLEDERSSGIGFKLKRAQWQMVRNQGLELATWTFDPLLSRNAYLNISKLGAVCNLYKRDVYGDMRDALNAGLGSDRFQVDWWLNSPRVERRLSKHARTQLDLAHYLAGDAQHYNRTNLDDNGYPVPLEAVLELPTDPHDLPPLLLVEIPPDFQALRDADMDLAGIWRQHTRTAFELLFASEYMLTDFVFLPGASARAYYVLSRGDQTLGA